MIFTFKIHPHGPDPKDTMRRIAGRIVNDLGGVLSDYGNVVHRQAVTAHMSAGAPPGLGHAHATQLSRRTGALARSLTRQRTGLELKLGATAIYARLHEEAVPEKLHPRRSTYMRLATDKALTAGGRLSARARREIESFKTTGRSNLQFVPRIRGAPAGGRLVHKDTGETWFILTDTVEPVKRPYLAPAIDETLPQLLRAIDRVLRRPFDAPNVQLRTSVQAAMGGTP